MAEHPPRNDDKKSAKQRGGRSHPKVKGTIDALVAELNNIQSRNSLKKVGADVVTPEGAAAAGIGEASTVPPELKQIYGDAPVPRDKVAILAKIKGKEKIASFLAQTAADVAERKSSVENTEVGNAEVKPPQTAPATAEESLTPKPPESELEQIKTAIARGDKAVGRTGGFVLKSLSELFYAGSEDEKRDIITLFANNKEKIKEAIGGTTYLNSFFDDLTMRAETYAPEIAKRNATSAPASNPETEPAVGVEPTAQPAETPAEKFNKRAAEVAEMLKGHNLGDGDPVADARMFMDFGRDEQAFELLNEVERKIKNGTYTTNAQPPEVATAVSAEPVLQQEKVQSGIEDFADEIKAMLSERLGDEAEVAGLTITKTPEGLRVQAELHQGMAGKIDLDGMLVSSGNTLGIDDLNVKADRFEKTVRKKIEENLSDFGSALQSHLEKKYGKPISGIRADESGFTIGFVRPAATEEKKPNAPVAGDSSDAGGEPKVEKTPAEIADGNRREALGVPKEFEGKYLGEIKLSYDPMHQLLERMANDPDVPKGLIDIGSLEYRLVVPGEKQGFVNMRGVRNHHDLLKQRALLSDDFRRDNDGASFKWEDSEGKPEGKWGKVATYMATSFWEHLKDKNGPLSKYRDEFWTLAEKIRDEQTFDEYARAISRGEVSIEKIKEDTERKQNEILTNLQQLERDKDNIYFVESKGRDLTQEEKDRTSKLHNETAKLEEQLRASIDMVEPYESDPLELDPLSDPDRVRARIGELQRLSHEINKLDSLDSYKKYEVLTRQWVGLHHKLIDAGESTTPPEMPPAGAPARVDAGAQQGETPVILGPEDVRQKRVQFNLLKKNLSGQNKELGTRAKEYGIKFESFVRNTGERYRKLPLKYKIGVAGALLGLNVATGGASTLVTLLTSTAMLGQRALGAASAYALIDGLYEKRLTRKEKERGSERTEFEKWKKRGYSTATALAVFTGLPGYAIKEGFDAVGGGGMLKALGALMGISPAVTELPHTIPKPAGAPAEPLVIDEIKQQVVEENARVATEVATPQESRQALRTAVEKLTGVSETADAKFEMPKHADFSIHEDDTEISPYDVTPTDQSGADDDIVQVSEEPQKAPVAEPELQQVKTETPIEPAEPLPVVEVPKPEYAKVDLTQEQASAETPSTSAETPNVKSLIARLETSPSPVEARSILDTLFSSHNVSPDTVAAAIKAAAHMNADPSLVNYIEPNTGAIPGPAVFLGQDGGLTVYGAASVGDTYTVQRTVAERFAALSGQSVRVLLPNGTTGYELVHQDGLVSVETPSLWNFSFKPPLPVTQSVYVFPR